MIKLAIHLARESLKTHRFRSSLTVLGVVLGVFMVSTILIIGDSLKNNLAQQASKLDDGTLVVNGSADDGSWLKMISQPNNTLDNSDIDNINKDLPGVGTTASLIINGTVQSDQNNSRTTTTLATSTNFFDTLNLKTSSGELFNDKESDKKWVILGNNLANQLLGTNVAQNQTISIKGERYTVVGVLNKVNQPLSIMGYNLDESAFISLKNGQQLTTSDKISQIIIKSKDSSQLVKTKVNLSLSKNHLDNSEYTIKSKSTMAKELSGIIGAITSVSFVFAFMALFLSGVGIMNVMLANIVERKREIGIRKAVGATSYDILSQFLVESLIMTIKGGIIGILLAYAVSWAVTVYLSTSLVFSWSAILMGFILPIIVGILSGVYPAYKAAKQDVITALKQLT